MWFIFRLIWITPWMQIGTDVSSCQELDVKHYSLSEIINRCGVLLKPYLGKLFIVGGLVTFAGISASLGPLFTKYVIDWGISGQSFRLVLCLAGIYLLSQFLRMGAWFVAQLLLMGIREKFVFQLRSLGFKHLQRMCMRFHYHYPAGFLYDRVFERSISGIAGFLNGLFSQFVVSIASLSLALTTCFYLDPRMTLVVLVGASGYVVLTRWLSQSIWKAYLTATEAHNWVSNYILDRIRGIRTIQSMAIEDRVQNDFDREVWSVVLKWMAAQRTSLLLGFGGEGLGYLITACVHVLGAYAIFHWEMSIGTLTAFIGYQSQVTGFLGNLSMMVGTFAMARAGVDQYLSILDTPSSIQEKPGAVMPSQIHGTIEFKHVTFGYGEKKILKNMNLFIPYGQSVALIGRSGAGKTTFANLLMRFFDPDEGSILLDSIDIRELPLRQYRSLFGMILQDPYFFRDTVLNNMLYAAPQATEKEIRVALERACAWDFVQQLPKKLNEVIGEGGTPLSGGQKQRLAIARCLLINPRFLILDEPTSALDNETESLVHQALVEVFKGRTSFIIAHRLSTIRYVDRILVLDEGKIVEDGNYAELMDKKGLFRHFHDITTIPLR